MTKKLNSTLIQIMHPVCCGLDVHKDKISACLITVDDAGVEQHEIREFSSTESLADYKRRVHKLFITANIKIDSIVSDLFGLTGINLIDLLCSDKKLSLKNVEECSRGCLKKKTHELYQSLHGYFKDHHRFQLVAMMDIINVFQKKIAEINVRLGILTQDYKDLLNRS